MAFEFPFTHPCDPFHLFYYLLMLHTCIVSVLFAFLNVDYNCSAVIVHVSMCFVLLVCTIRDMMLSATSFASWFFIVSMLNMSKSKLYDSLLIILCIKE